MLDIAMSLSTPAFEKLMKYNMDYGNGILVGLWY